MKLCPIILAFILLNFHLHSKSDPVESVQIAYLGVYTSKVNPSLSHQLKLTENLYLSVERVEKGSPAEKAGIQQFDILLQLDDQILINSEQLKYLVRSKKPQDKITLTFLRRGDRKNTSLVLGGINKPIEKELDNSHSGNPFFSTDTAASLRASEMNCSIIIKATKVDGIYDKDPEKNKNAIKFDSLSFDEVLKRGLKVMDTTAFTLSQENNLPIIVFDMNTKGNLSRIINGENIGPRVI